MNLSDSLDNTDCLPFEEGQGKMKTSIPIEEGVTKVTTQQNAVKRVANGGKTLPGTSVQQGTTSFLTSQNLTNLKGEEELEVIRKLEKEKNKTLEVLHVMKERFKYSVLNSSKTKKSTTSKYDFLIV